MYMWPHITFYTSTSHSIVGGVGLMKKFGTRCKINFEESFVICPLEKCKKRIACFAYNWGGWCGVRRNIVEIWSAENKLRKEISENNCAQIVLAKLERYFDISL